MNLSNPDLKIELSPSQLARMDKWLHGFYSKCKSRMSDPVIDDGFLNISSADIYNFLMAIDVNDECQFDWYRLRVTSSKIIQYKIHRRKNKFLRDYYCDIFNLIKKDNNG